MLKKPYQSTGVKAWNLFSKVLPNSIMAPDLSRASLLKAAVKEAGYSDFGKTTFIEPLEKLLASVDQTTNLHSFGKFYFKKIIVGILVNRLKLIELWKSKPAILKEKIISPFIILGLPRTGTSFLFSLLAQDPAHRYLSNWEATVSQVPLKGAYTYLKDPRRKVGKFLMRFQNYLAPHMKDLHSFSLDGPEECTPILLHEFANQSFAGMFNIPDYSNWLKGHSYDSTYLHHKKVLQTLQWKYPGERWLLKSPHHIEDIEQLLLTYPSASIIQTYRDPVKVVSSFASLCAAFRGIASREINYSEIGQQAMNRLAEDFDSFDKQRRQCDPKRFLDINYNDLVNDPIKTVKKVYQYFDIVFSVEAERQMHKYLDTKSQKKSAHNYCSEDFGLTPESIRERFKKYMNACGIKNEFDKERGSCEPSLKIA